MQSGLAIKRTFGNNGTLSAFRLCSFGYLGRAVLEKFTDDTPERFKSIQVRFSKPVFPGETIVSEMWKVSPTEIVCKARLKERSLDVITNAKVTLTG